jgi:hypothetical protein
MSYTPDEIQEAVEKLVNGSIRRPLDTLGVRRTDVTFSDVQEAAAGVFILKPLAPFYAVLHGSKRLLESTRAVAVLVSNLMAQVGAVGRRVLPVADVEALFNARAALQQLEVAVSKQAPKDITKLPAFQRFALNVQDFLVREGSKVKSGGSVVPTPQEARLVIPSLVRELTTAHQELVTSAALLADAIEDYNRVNLPSLVAKGVVSRAREVLSTHADELEGMLPEERLSKVRAVVLDLLAAKSVVQKFGSSGGLTTFVTLSGNGLPFADASHLATPASKMADLGAPYAIYSGTDILEVAIDDDLADSVIALNYSLIATMNGLRAEVVEPGGTGFIIGDGASPALPDYDPPNNNELKFRVTNITGFSQTVTVALTLSALSGSNAVPRTAQQVCDNINTALTSASLNTRWKAEPYFFPASFLGTMDITSTGVSTIDITFPPNTGGDLQFVLWTVTSKTSTTLSCTQVSGSGPANESLVYIEVGDTKRAVRIRAIDPATQILNEEQLDYIADSDKNRNGANTIGLNIFSQTFCRPTTAQQVADDINVKLPRRLNCTAIVDGAAMKFRTEPGTSLQLVSSKLQTLGNITYTAGSPNVINVDVPSGGLLDAGVSSGDTVVLRGGTPGGTSWLITTLSDTGCTALSLETAINGTGVSIEFGAAPNISRWDAIDIPTGVLQGRYYVQKQGTSKLDIVLFAALNAMQDPATRLPLLAEGTYGTEKLVVTSRDTGVTSAINVDDGSSAAGTFWNSPSSTAYGTTPWFQLPQANNAVDTGDQLEVHASDYNTPSQKYAITSVNGDIIGISPEMPSQEVWSFNDQPPPFARIRNGVNLNYTEFKALLVAWLAREVNATTYYRDLNRYLNPLLQNATPTAEQIGTALSHLEMLLDYLIDHEETMIDPADSLEGAVTIYSVDPVGELDTLIKSLVEKGADRATDLLVSGQFSAFFGMDVHDVSYASFMQKSMRSIVQNDLPVRSTRRVEATHSRLRSSAESPDYEFTMGDVEDVGVPDIPADYDDTPR